MNATAVKVVDASALAAVMFNEPAADEIARRVRGATLTAPTLLSYEIVNACVTRLRRHPDLRDQILEAFALQGGLAIETAEVDHTGGLALAELVTLDGPLGRAAAALGLAQPP